MKVILSDQVTYTHKQGNTTQSVMALLTGPNPPDEEYPGANMTFEIITADLSPAPVKGDQITFQGKKYAASDLQSDGLYTAFITKRVL
jgi:hypothetical protein